MTLHEYLEKEKRLPELDSVEINGVPIWRIVRSRFRWTILDNYPFSVSPNKNIKKQLYNNHCSFCGLLRLLLTPKKIDTVIFPHPRLFEVNGKYMERLSDPLIDNSSIGGNYLIFERHQNGIHREPRIHAENVVYLDFIDNFTRLLGPIMVLINRFRYRKQVNKIIATLDKEFIFDKKKVKTAFVNLISASFMRKILISPILNQISPKCVFIAPRLAYYYVLSYCKQHDIKVIELQHGVTVGETELYSGCYNERIDPDYFFVFGKANIGPQFGMPVDKVINIGFPYKNYVKSLGLKKYGSQVILVISEPEISAKVVELLTSFVNYYPGFIFHIRCHPQEKFSDELLERLNDYKQIMIVDNKIESFCALSQYECVIGENSTVMYEAMSMCKKVGRLNYGGFCVKETDLIHGGTKINSHDELIKFVNSPYSDEYDSKDVYSDFDINALNCIINSK